MVQHPPYQERQRFSRRWVLGLLGATAVPLVLLAPGSILGWVVWGTVALFLLSVRLRTEVRDDGVYVELWPIHWSFRHIPWPDIERCEPIEYNSVLRFGGWGLRVTPSEVAYTVGGSSGVLIERAGRRSVLVGSERADAFHEAIQTRIGQ
jgi:hypothetical protein